MTLRFDRRLTNSLILVYIPTLLICLICHLTVYFHEEYFEAVVAVNLTCLLCLITMFNRYKAYLCFWIDIFTAYYSSTTEIMKTSYIKYMDVWFFASLCVPFLEVVLVTVTDLARRDDEGKWEGSGTDKQKVYSAAYKVVSFLRSI